jgi:NTP pyrophosphatase (non-canonical NTP hydrolase)
MNIEHAEMVRVLAKSGETIRQELTQEDVISINLITELCAFSISLFNDLPSYLGKHQSPEAHHATHMAIGFVGECGELLDAIKKSAIYRKPLDRENCVEELGDLEFYFEGYSQVGDQLKKMALNQIRPRLSNIYAHLGITREEAIAANIAKLGKRYEGMKYSDKAAHDRADKQ